MKIMTRHPRHLLLFLSLLNLTLNSCSSDEIFIDAPFVFSDIDNVEEDDLSDLKQMVAVGTFDPENANYVDAPSGNIFETAIDEIAPDDLENPVYLLNLGYEVGTGKPNTGSVNFDGERGHPTFKYELLKQI